MNFNKSIIFFILSLLISANIYAKNNSNTQYILDAQALPEYMTNSNDCKNITFITNPIKHINCKLNHNKSVALPPTPITAGSPLFKSITKKDCGPCVQQGISGNLEPGMKINWTHNKADGHYHDTCSGDQDYWRFEVLHQNPYNCECFTTLHKDFHSCGSGSMTPSDYNNIKWKNQDNTHKPCSEWCTQGSTVLKRNSKVNWRLDEPGGHSHYDCPKEAGHWHWEILNQDPNTCRCHANKNGKFYVCGSEQPYDWNDDKWVNNYVYY